MIDEFMSKRFTRNPSVMDLELNEQKLNVFVAHTKTNRVYANDEGIPWKNDLKKEMKFVIKMTSKERVGVIMGRLTHESIGKPLPNRVNIVVSSSLEEKEGIVVKKSFDEALEYCKEKNLIPVIFGGRKIYDESMKHPCKFFITIVDDMEYTGDKTFPELDIELKNINEEVKDVIEDEYNGEKFMENGVGFSFFVGEN